MSLPLLSETSDSIRLNFAGEEVDKIAFRRKGSKRLVLSSPTLGARCAEVSWGDGIAALVLFLLHHALWVAIDPDRARCETDEARRAGERVPATAPHWLPQHGSFVATLAELLKQKQKAGSIIERVFGKENLSFVDDVICFRRRRPNVWLEVLSEQLTIEIVADDGPVTDPAGIIRLMDAVARSRGWSIKKLLDSTQGLSPEEE